MVAGMLMPLRDLRAIYEVLFRDGVMVAKKDKRPQIKHPEVQDVSNLQVIRAMGSLKSRGYVKETFAWRHFYWYLTNEGIVYLRDYLHLPPEIVPASLQRVRKPAATLAIARGTRVQSVEGPTSYVPKPGRRSEAESEEALAERQGYRHKMMGPREKESYSERTPRFRGRPLAAEPVKPKASWEMEVEDQPQTMFRKGNFRNEAAVMDESRVKRGSHQHPDMSRERPVTTSRERRVVEVQKEKVTSSSPIQTAALKQDVSQTTLTSVSFKTAPPLNVPVVTEATGGTTSKIQAEPSSLKTNEEKPKITDEKASIKSSEMVTSNAATTMLTNTKIKEEKIKKVVVNQIKSGEIMATAETDKVQSQAGIAMTAAQETTTLLIDTATATPVFKKPVNKDVMEEKTKEAIVDQVKSAEVKRTVETATDKRMPQAVTTMASVQESSVFLTDTDTTTPVNTKVVKEEKVKKRKVAEESVKPTEVKIPVPVEAKIDHEKAKKTDKVSVTQETTKPKSGSTTITPVASTNVDSKVKVAQEPIDTTLTSVNLSEKPETDDVLQKTATVTESSILEVTTTVSTSLTASMANAEVVQPATEKTTVTEKITKQEKSNVKTVAHVNKDGKIAPGDIPKDSIQEPALVQKDSSSNQHSQNVGATEVVKETKHVTEGSSKSKRKKKKSPGETSKTVSAEELPETKAQEVKSCKDKLLEEVLENTLQPIPVITSETLTVTASIKTEGTSPAAATKDIDREQIKEIPEQTDGRQKEEVQIQTTTLPSMPLEKRLDDAQVKERVEVSSVSKITQGPVCTTGELNVMLPQMEPLKSEKITVTKVEIVTGQKITQVELESSQCEEKIPASLPESEKPTVDTKSLINTGKAADESSKSKKKGKGKKQAKATVSATINTKLVILPEAFPSTDITPLPKAAIKESPVMASALTETNVSLKMTPEGMCSEETRQAAAVLSEAPADKGEVEPVPLFAEKIKREVPKPKTSSTAREAPAAGELASAALAATAEAAVAQAQTSPLVKQEEPPRVAQHSATQATECSTETRLSVSEALKQEEEKKDSKEDTPSATVTPAAAQPDQPHLGDTCEPINSDTDEANMKRKIVVVEEIVEVKQLISPEATEGQLPPPPVQTEVEGEELDLDVLEQLAIERALLSGAAGVKVQGASPEAEWDHSLEKPEEKTWPNFIEGLFESMPINLLPALSCLLRACDVITLTPSSPPFFEAWEVLGRVFDDGSVVDLPHCHVLMVFHSLKNISVL